MIDGRFKTAFFTFVTVVIGNYDISFFFLYKLSLIRIGSLDHGNFSFVPVHDFLVTFLFKNNSIRILPKKCIIIYCDYKKKKKK